MRSGTAPSEREKLGIREQAWELLVLENAIRPQYNKLGIEVSDAELKDMMMGKNISPDLKQQFTDPATGEFDRQRFLQQLGQISKDQLIQYETGLRKSRERLKYENLILKSNYVTTAEAELEHHLENDVAEVKYLYIPYFAVSDSAVTVSDSDLQEYYNKNKERFKTKETRGIKYVTFPIVPSAEDSAAIRSEIDAITNELKQSKDDSVYASSITAASATFETYHVGNIPTYINKADLVEGNIIGPVIDGNVYRVVKVSKVYNGVGAASARHILVTWADTTTSAKAQAKAKAEGILKDIQGGADFTTQAQQFSEDQSNAMRGGDLGWFTETQMVKPFADAVFKATKTGVANELVETEYGYHIVDVKTLKNTQAYKLTIVEQAIEPSEKTSNAAYRQAEQFASGLSDEKEFEARAKEMQRPVFEAKSLTAQDNRIGNLGEGREIVQWAFADAKVGSVSRVFDLQDVEVVAVMTNIIEEGYKPLDFVENDIRPKVVNELKAKHISEKLKGKTGSLEEMASAFGAEANVYTKSDLHLIENFMTGVGYDPKVVGAAFSVPTGKRSEPLAGESGVVVIEAQNITKAPEASDVTEIKEKLRQAAYNTNSMNIAPAIKEKSDIEDRRYKVH
jgi:peptidyl-prolyl cis-trans isomerase D